MSYILGLDVGTTSVKACVTDGFIILVEESEETVAGVGGQQNVKKILSAVDSCVGRIDRHLMSQICKISVCGQMHGVVLWIQDSISEVGSNQDEGLFQSCTISTSPLYTWQDSTCTPEFLATLPPPCSHLRVCTGYGCATLFWKQKNEVGMLLKYDRAATVQDFVVALLCGLCQPVMTIHNAASWGYFNTEVKQWNLEILTEANFPVHLMPEVVDVGTIAGVLSVNWFSIPAGIPILAAFGDMQCSVFSTLATVPTVDWQRGLSVLNISTSTQLSFVMPEGFHPSKSDGAVEYFPFLENRYLAVAASLNGGNVLAELVATLKSWLHDLGCDMEESIIWQKLLTVAQSENANTANPILVEPVLLGERHLPDRRAAITNITAGSTRSLGQIFRAVCKGIASNLHSMLPVEKLGECGVEHILGTGSALSRNVVLRDEIAWQYKTISFEMSKEGNAAFGAALIPFYLQSNSTNRLVDAQCL